MVLGIERDAWSTVTILPASASARPAVFRPGVVIAGRDTKILTGQIRTIGTGYVTGELVDYLSRDDMAHVEHSLSRYLGLVRISLAARCGSAYPPTRRATSRNLIEAIRASYARQ